jgi:CRISPR-associated endonuclease/helicase Cas3
MMRPNDEAVRFRSFFCDATGFEPYEWQVKVAIEGLPEVLPVPTALGKTEGVALAWAWRHAAGIEEPRHLVYCLPMRTLVVQTVERLKSYFDTLKRRRSLEVTVYQLMGGAIDEGWARWPDKPWVLVGTQDQLLSRALNRGYAMSRFEWPVHFGLLNNDCHWVIDEVQLMGPGLWTTAQLDWMRQRRFRCVKPCRTTWMSATVGPGFLATTDRMRDGLGVIPSIDLPLDSDPHPEMKWRRGVRRAAVQWLPNGNDLASDVRRRHRRGTLSLVVCNTVDTARTVFSAVPDSPPKVLLTARFRRQDREEHERRLLEFETKRRAEERKRESEGRLADRGKPIPNDDGLICVSTQVVEAGLDISAHQLWSELAPWPSVIQRLGRLNRDGRDNEAKAWIWETPESDGDKKKRSRTGPYDHEDVERAKKLVDALVPLSDKPFAEAVGDLEQYHAEEVKKALQPKLTALPRALDVHGLFSTEHDLHGGFTDVSAFVRGTDPDADLTVFWRDWQGTAPPRGHDLDGPSLEVQNEGCAVPFFSLRDALKAQRAVAWTWNDELDAWERVRPEHLRPGMVIMLHRDIGGYDARLGWTGERDDVLADVPRAGRGRALHDDERTEAGYWASLDAHLADARSEAERLCAALGLDDEDQTFPYIRSSIIEAAALHDLGKAHLQWQQALPAAPALPSAPWAKCPRVLAVDVRAGDAENARAAVARYLAGALALPDDTRRPGREELVRLRWGVAEKLKRQTIEDLKRIGGVRWAGHIPFRPGMRHEAASALAMWRRYREGGALYPALAVYLAASHHGKVRTVLRAITDRGDDVFGVPRDAEALDLSTRRWPLDFSVARDGAEGEWCDDGFVLTGYGWTGLVADLLGPWRAEDEAEVGVLPHAEPRRLGPFVLAYLEALVRVADWRASERPSASIKPEEVSRGR